MIDTSKSMKAKFKLNRKKTKRITYVKNHLVELLKHELKPHQSFNIISFGWKVKKFSSKHVKATPENIKVVFKIIIN